MHTINSPIPIILIRGFLEAGKTTLINRLINGRKICTDNTLLISCEEGETAFDNVALNENHITLIDLENESKLNRDYLEYLSALYTPSMVIIECNVMWKMIEFEIPRNWKVIKRIAVLSGPTLSLYLDNMRAYLGPMLSRCDQIIINRCDSSGLDMLSPIKSKLRPLLDDISSVLIESCGSTYGFNSIKDLVPYALDTNIIAITPENYGFWFYDCQDHRSRYEGRRISLDASIKKSPVLDTGEFALGRIAMTCCEADMSFLGYIAHYDQIDSFPQYSYVHVEADINYRFMQKYKAIMPYLEIIRMDLLTPNDRIVTF